MDVNVELPDNLEWYKDQIAGHHPSVVRDGYRQIGIVKEKGSELLLKLVQDGVRGQNEVGLYERLQAVTSKPTHVTVTHGAVENGGNHCETNGETALIGQLYGLVPKYHGRRVIRLGKRDYEFLQLEDITHGYTNPCILDVKMGRVSYDPLATEAKRASESAKCPEQVKLGFRVLGYRLHPDTSQEPIVKDRLWGRDLGEETIQPALEEYLLRGRPEDVSEIVRGFAARLDLIREWFNRQQELHFYASSLLFVYEANRQQGIRIDIRMIDFGHVFTTASGKDENYLHGLNYLCNLLSRIRDTPQHNSKE